MDRSVINIFMFELFCTDGLHGQMLISIFMFELFCTDGLHGQMCNKYFYV